MFQLHDDTYSKFMDGLTLLDPWIQPRHLQADALLSYRKSFETHPARFVVLKRFLQEAVAERLSRFLREEAEFCVEYGLYSTGEEAASEEEWLRAAAEDRFFRFSKLVGTPSQYKFSLNTLTYLRFRKAFQEPNFRTFFQELSGMRLGWSDDFGSHMMKAGDFLRPHTDNNRNRRLALVIYLSPGWEPCFGGALNMIDGQGNRARIEAEYNSMVVFDVAAGTTHFVDAIIPDAEDRVRLTIGGWYHKPG